MTTLTDWLGTFLNILIKPSANTFREEAKKAKGKTISAYSWLVLLFLVSAVINDYITHGGITDYLRWYAVIIASLVLPLGFLFFIFVLHTLYKKLFNRKKELHSEFLYIITAILFIAVLINSLTIFLPAPFMTYAGHLINAYIVFMMIFAIKALTNMKVWQSIVTIVLSILIGGLGFICVPVFILLVTSTTPDFLGF